MAAEENKEKIKSFICDLMLARAGNGPDPAGPPEIAAGDFLAQCAAQGMSALVYRAAKGAAHWAAWPEELRAGLQRAVYGQAIREVARAGEIKKIAGHCHASGIFPILMKGAALAHTHYDAPGDRPCADIDFFIAPDAVEQVIALMRGLGYHVARPIYKSHQFTCLKHSGEQASTTIIDVHWRVNNNPRFARVLGYSEALARATRIAALEGCHGLGAVHALLLACIHQATDTQHGPGRLIWLHDIYLLVSRMPDAELRDFARLAAERDAREVCLAAIGRAGQCFGFGLPAGAAELFRPVPSPPRGGLRARFARSYLGLLCDDFHCLRPGSTVALLGELLMPAASSLLAKYNKKNRWWLPVLYPRHFWEKAGLIVHELFAGKDG